MGLASWCRCGVTRTVMMKAFTQSRHRRGRAADVIFHHGRPVPPAPCQGSFLGTWPVPGFNGVRATICPRCQAAGFVEAGLSGAGGCGLGLAGGLLAEVVGVWGPGGFMLGGGDHGWRRCRPKVAGRMTANGAMIRRRCNAPAQSNVPSASPGPII